MTLYQPDCDLNSMFCYIMRFYNKIYNIYIFHDQKKHRSGLDYSNIFPIHPMNSPRNSKLPIKHNDMVFAEKIAKDVFGVVIAITFIIISTMRIKTIALP